MDLSALVDSLKRAVAAPGEFDTFFPDSTDDDLGGVLADAVAECQLDGFLSTTVLDVDELTADPLTNPQQALVVFYAMSRVLVARIANLKNKTHYSAKQGLEVDQEQSASVLVELLKETNARKVQLLDDARTGNLARAFTMVDMYVAKAIDFSSPDVGYLTGTQYLTSSHW